MRRREIEALPTVSVRGVMYVEIAALLEALAAEAEAAKAEPEAPAVPRREKPADEKGKA